MSAAKPHRNQQSRHSKAERFEIEKKSKLLEQIYVHDVYERIADDFECQQYKPWPKIREFLLNLEPGSLVLDVGCGNGHYLNINPHIAVLGADRSNNLLNSASQRSSGVLCRTDCLSLPYRDSLFDAVLFIGVIHHLVSSERQAKAIKELERVVRPGGSILIYAWAWEQEKRKFVGQNLLVPRCVPETACEHGACNSSNKMIVERKSQNNLTDRLGKLMQGPQLLFKRLVTRTSSLESCDDSSSTNSVQSADSSDEWVICDEKSCSDDFVEIPAEFQVREFPASSLFSTSPLLNQKSHNSPQSTSQSTQPQLPRANRFCRNHPTSPSQGRNERYYHVFKQRELENLIKKYAKNLIVSSCTYQSGHWCAEATKISCQKNEVLM